MQKMTTSSRPESVCREFKKEFRIDALGRFGNYFFAHGWQTVGAVSDIQIGYRLSSESETCLPEFAFHYPCEEIIAKYTNAPKEICQGARFLHFFWINDGYKAVLCADRSAQANIRVAGVDQSDLVLEIPALRERDADYFISCLAASESREVWQNRLVLEIVATLPVDKQILFHLQSSSCIGWKAAESAFLSSVEGLSPSNRANARLRFYGQPILTTPAAYLGVDLTQRFDESLSMLEQPILAEIFETAFRCLHKISPPKAYDYAAQFVASSGWSRKEIAANFLEFFPANAKWWLKAVLENDHLGDEQAAEALNIAGTGAHSQNQPEFGSFCQKLAVHISPKAQSASWNLGISAMELGDISAARAAFQRVTRHYPNQSLSTRWPSCQGVAWPYRPMPVEGFQLPEGVDRWPRISIITPSYNQAAFIEETLLSVFNQNYPNLQYIVIDGASTDGSVEILERYRDRLDHLVIEKDKGQTEAINKGLRLVDGGIIAWLNSDDIYGPGSLHQAALAWLQSGADVFAGICSEHTDRRLLLVNKPAAWNADFNPPQLARIFRYWLKGYYFYQPEVFFTRRILDQVGLLDESLYYSMDYDLWMRFSKAGAALEILDWPVAFFRKHAAQKTHNLVDTIEEQARVRSRHHALQPGEQRLAQIGRMLAPLRAKKPLRVGILTKRIGKIFSKNMQEELDLFCGPDFACYLSDDERDPDIAGSDLIILLVHVLNDLEVIKTLRAAKPDRPIIGWFWDNHHHLFENHAVAEALDLIIPGHDLYGEYLRNDHAIHGGHVPLCITQWTRQDTAGWFQEFGAKERSPALYGGFVDYAFEPHRTTFLHKAIEHIPGNDLKILSEANLATYFGRSEKERFEEWCGYQTSLVLPLRNDLSQRVFDALLAGQIPLVPEEIRDLDLVVPPEMQEKLPIIRFSMRDFTSCQRAYEKATNSFAKDGHAGCLRRHQFALEQHTFSSMINVVIAKSLINHAP
jgi:GT2 family glycosyltransferase